MLSRKDGFLSQRAEALMFGVVCFVRTQIVTAAGFLSTQHPEYQNITPRKFGG